MSRKLRPVIERRGVACSYVMEHDEVLKLLSEIAKQADAGETRCEQYGDVTVLVIEKGAQFLDALSAGRKAIPRARQDGLHSYRPTLAENALLDNLSRLTTAWRQSIDPCDWSVRIYIDRYN
jgi:hypothetical protein